MRKLSILCFSLVSLLGPVQAQELSPSEASGKVVFDKWCEGKRECLQPQTNFSQIEFL